MPEKIKLAIASDLSGFNLKCAIVEYLAKREDIEVIDFGIASVDAALPYTEQAPKVAKAIQSGQADKGILICGTGQGMAIVANKFKGVYACVVDSVFSAERAKIVNDANVITMGGWITAPFLGVELVQAWLSVSFAQKMEFKRDFLAKNLDVLHAIEKENFT